MIKNKKAKIMKKRGKKKENTFFSFFMKSMFILILVCIFVIGIGLTGLYFYIAKDLPRITKLRDYKPSIVTNVYSDDGRKIGEFYEKRRIVIPLSDMPENLKNAFIAAEDSRFRTHPGVDILSIFRAFIKNIKAGAVVQGGSTITQQVTKSFFLTNERTYKRKIKEVILAYRIDKTFTKDEILYFYLNQIYLGHGAYGVESAAENYFDKEAKEMNLAECSLLAGLPQAPSKYSPFKYPDRARQRQIYVLNRMKEDEYITNLQATKAINTKLDIKPRKNWFIDKVPCYTEHIRRIVEERYGKDALYKQGLQIHTAVNIEFQKIAREQVVKGLEGLEKRQGYRGPLKTLSYFEIEEFCQEISLATNKEFLKQGITYKGVIVSINNKYKIARVRVGNEYGIIKINNIFWSKEPKYKNITLNRETQKLKKSFQIGDVILVQPINLLKDSDLWQFSLEQETLAQSALLSIEAETGHVKAMIGGKNFKDSQFNRAIQSRRQPGSAFKPIIYAAALDKGYTAASIIIDSPIVFTDASRDFTWKPHNYKEKFYGPTLFRQALVKSCNVVTIKILQDISIDYIIKYARKLGIESKIDQNLSISLGSSGLSLLEIIKAYSVFSNLGYLIEPVFITKIIDRDGNIIEESRLKREKVIDMSTAYIMTNLLEDVVQSGTGRRVKALQRPAAGKTGTTNNHYDAWFIGYTPRYTTGVWVGIDDEISLGKDETGSKAASPIWLGYMQEILKDKTIRTFNVPAGVVFANIDAGTGLLPIEESEKIIFECFKEGTIPTQLTPRPNIATKSDVLFKSGI
ncbi:MAG: penicillin-binding protein [Desulfobacteraceae bacterium 4572_130]|nr:MAG: penicillin-binding protein [Desulfobacteraceae bacterium 4572_130]